MHKQADWTMLVMYGGSFRLSGRRLGSSVGTEMGWKETALSSKTALCSAKDSALLLPCSFVVSNHFPHNLASPFLLYPLVNLEQLRSIHSLQCHDEHQNFAHGSLVSYDIENHKIANPCRVTRCHFTTLCNENKARNK